MAETPFAGEGIVIVTNVGPTILRAYFRPLAQLEGVGRLTIVRDKEFEPFAENVEWCSSASQSRNIVGRLATRSARVAGSVRRRRPGLVMVMHWFPDGFYVYPLTRMLRTPLIVHIIGGTAEIDDGARKIALSGLPGAIKRFAQRTTRAMLDRAAAITFTGETTMTAFRARGVKNPALFVVRPLVSCDLEVQDVGDRPIHIVYVGRIDADKRFDRFLRVLAALAARLPRVVVRVCGIERDDAAAQEETAGVVLPDNLQVDYLGHVRDVRPELRRSRVFMLSSDSEGLSLAMLESMGCGTVPIVTDVGDIGVTLGEAGAGVAVKLTADEAANTLALAERAAELLSDDEAWQRQSTLCHSYVRERHSMESTQADWRRVLAVPRRSTSGSLVPSRH